jgi:peptidoglycan hydrolase-like protein with peptidoglycan-binding domain
MPKEAIMRDWIYDLVPGGSRQVKQYGPAWTRPPAILVLHSTEGASYPSYAPPGGPPHFTIHPWARTFRQHIPLSTGARALKAPITSRAINSNGTVQIEIVGSCVDGRTPNVTDLAGDPGAFDYLARVIDAILRETGIPAATSVNWYHYPESYGAGRGQRLPYGSAWLSHRGIIGHQHVPDNTHGDPGDFPIGELLARLDGVQVTPVDNPVPLPVPAPAGHSVLQQGSRGAEVRTLQTFLGGLVVDGEFGPATKAAVIAYQRAVGLLADGIVGAHTWAAIDAGLRVVVPVGPSHPAPAPTYRDCTAIQRAVRATPDNWWGADTDKRVNAVRAASRWAGGSFPYGVAYTQQVVGTVADGDWGPKSSAAHDATVAAIQRAVGVTDDGIWGPATEAAVNAARAAARRP